VTTLSPIEVVFRDEELGSAAASTIARTGAIEYLGPTRLEPSGFEDLHDFLRFKELPHAVCRRVDISTGKREILY
jgi:hypothetical protein